MTLRVLIVSDRPEYRQLLAHHVTLEWADALPAERCRVLEHRFQKTPMRLRKRHVGGKDGILRGEDRLAEVNADDIGPRPAGRQPDHSVRADELSCVRLREAGDGERRRDCASHRGERRHAR